MTTATPATHPVRTAAAAADAASAPTANVIEWGYARRGAAIGLGAAGLLLAGFTVLQPEFHQDGLKTLESINAASTSAAISHTMFVVAQLPLLIGILAFAFVVRPRAPKLAAVVATLALIGGFGHMVYGGVSGVQLPLAGESDLARMGELVETIGSNVLLTIYAALGLLGTVFGTILLGVLALRTREVPAWVGGALIAFVLLEFFLNNLTAWASLLAGVVYLFAMVALARRVWAARPA